VNASEQAEARCRCDWGANGLAALPPADLVIVVDVLSFSTCVDIAVGRGVAIIPYDWNDSSAAVFAACRDAEVAGSRGNSRYSLSPASFLDAPAGLRCVLPSPNGGSVALRGVAAGATVIAACLRNISAVVEAAGQLGASYNVIAAGERWQSGTLRRSTEDWVAAGAILQRLPGSKSPRAAAAIGAFERVRDDLGRFLAESGSGRELIARGFQRDVELAAAVDVSPHVPIHDGEAFVSALSAGRPGNRKSNGRPGRCV
jgi:2-phosphosulfolactate phosphatase